MSTESGLRNAFLLDGKGGAKELDWAQVGTWHPNDGVLWVNLDYSMADARAWLDKPAGLDPLVRDALLDADPRPRATAHGEDLMLIVRGVNMNEGSDPEDMISIRAWIEPRRIITMRHRVSRSLKQVAADVERGAGPTNAAALTVAIAERIVEHLGTRVDRLGDDVAACEEGALGDARSGDLRTRIADLRRRAITLRRFLGPQREALTKLAQINLPWLDAHHRQRLVEVADRMTRTLEELDAARDRAAVTQEELSSRQSETTNQRLYILSIITAVFLPLGFVCSLLGVNVGGVPFMHDDWAFYALCGVFAVGVGLQIWFFRRRGWIRKD